MGRPQNVDLEGDTEYYLRSVEDYQWPNEPLEAPGHHFRGQNRDLWQKLGLGTVSSAF